MSQFNNIKEKLASIPVDKSKSDEIKKYEFPIIKEKSDFKIFSKEIKIENIISKEEVKNFKENRTKKEKLLTRKLEQIKKEYDLYLLEMEINIQMKENKINELSKKNLDLENRIASLEQTILLQKEINKKLKQIITEQTKVYMDELKKNTEVIKQHKQEIFKTIARTVHDLKNPLTSIKSTAEVLSEYEDLDEDKKILVNLILSGAEDLSKMIEEILISNKIVHNVYVIEKKETSFSKILKDIVEQTEIYAKRIGKVIYLDIEEDLKANVDEIKIKRAISNLISNGLKYGKQYVSISAKALKDQIEIEISDDGEGFNSEIKEKIFSYKEMSTTDLINGNGFGLTNAKTIIELHGGQISLLPSERGTTFKITIPKE